MKLPGLRHHSMNSEHFMGFGKTTFGGAVCFDYDQI
jgi:hypothetical protein